MKRVLKKLKTPGKWVGFAILILAMALALFVSVAPWFGWQIETIRSGSMEPALNVGGAVIVTQVDPYTDIKVGDIITYRSPVTETHNCHRVVDIQYIGAQPNFITQGDAKQEPDPYTVYPGDVEGKVIFHAPYFGYVANFARTTLGRVTLLVVPGVIIIAWELRNIWKTVSELEKKKRSVDGEQSNPSSEGAAGL